MAYKFVDLRTSVDPKTGERITPEEFERRGYSGVNATKAELKRIAEQEARDRAWEAREPAEPIRIGLQVVPDIQPYKSMITGEMIKGRKQHRDHLKAHNCIEVGNEKPKPHKPEYVGGVAHDIRAAMEKHLGS